MGAPLPAPAASRLFLSGNEAVARAVWEAGCKVAAAYPGTPSTEILEELAHYPDLYAEWSVNEKVSLEVALGASMMGARAFCAMKHVGLNVASDALMTMTVTGTEGGLVIAVADDVGMSSSQNEQDSRFWGRFAHLPVLEPADAQEAYAMTKAAFEMAERHRCPVILRLTTLFEPLRVFLPLAAIFIVGGLAWGVPYILLHEGVSVGAMLLIVTGVLTFFFGLLADQNNLLRRRGP